MKTYPFPKKIRKVICSDLDETFLPYDEKNKSKSGINMLEEYLIKNIRKHELIFGWITGTNLNSALNKTKDHINYLPHFIASSLGTEFYWIDNGEPVEPKTWKKLISDSGYSKEKIEAMVIILDSKGINLMLQSEDYQGKYKTSFYYHIKDSIENDFKEIEKIAKENNCKVLLNKSNPAAGDPENSYDVEFIPICCGKGEVVDFLKKELSITKENFYAFGDSFNDFSMFEKVEYAFLVANADPLAKREHSDILSESYCTGITKKLKEII